MLESSPYNISIVGTGSSGNSIMLDDAVMIDCGLKTSIQAKRRKKPVTAEEYALVEEFTRCLRNVQHLFITHRHGDHLNITALRWIVKNVSPEVIKHGLHVNKDCFAMLLMKAPDIADLITNPFLDSNSNFEIEVNGEMWNVQTYELIHDVENQGFIFTKPDGTTLIQATDTATMKYAPESEYDILLVEGNWDEDRIIESLNSEDYGDRFRASRNLRHLSIQAHKDFVRRNSHSNSIIYMLHESFDFGLNSGLLQENSKVN